MERHSVPGARKTHLIFCDDLHDVAGYLRDQPARWTTERYGSRSGGMGGSWDLGVGYEGAWKLARDGWAQGAADLHTAVAAIQPEKFLAEDRWDIAGERCDVPRYLTGDPANMVRRGRQNRQKPVVHLIVNGSVSCAVGAKAIAAYGAALTAVIDQIENAGRRVELDIVFGVDGLPGGNRLFVGWKVKRAEDHCDMSAIAFSIAHPASFRRIGFALMERAPREYQTSSYGMPCKMTKADLGMMDSPDAVILPGVGKSWSDLKPDQMLLMAADHINDAAGETIVHIGDD